MAEGQSRKDSLEFEQVARKKIAGWYSKIEHEDQALTRMVAQRAEIIDLLNSTNRDGMANVIQYLDDSGFFYRASSPHGHHNYPGRIGRALYWHIQTSQNTRSRPAGRQCHHRSPSSRHMQVGPFLVQGPLYSPAYPKV